MLKSTEREKAGARGGTTSFWMKQKTIKSNGSSSIQENNSASRNTVAAWNRAPDRNPRSEDLIFIEIQCGEYFGGDDIEWMDDDFGRKRVVM